MHTAARWLVHVIAVGALAAGVVAALAEGDTPPPCAAEDGPGPCLWDAQHRGNGLGHSFVMDSAGQVHYLYLRD